MRASSSPDDPSPESSTTGPAPSAATTGPTSSAGTTPLAATAGAPQTARRGTGARTRALLLESARRRFAHDGYAATTVRDIADDAGVNVALINRYFRSKEGLFEACLKAVIGELSREAGTVADLEQIPEVISGHTAGVLASDAPRDALLLLLRSSGDERTERMRTGLLRTFSERLASAAGWRPDAPGGEQLLLRAQLVLSVAFGITVLRASRGLEPLASATEKDLGDPLRDVVDALLATGGTGV
ncbi:TetR family transcriptional regulator [Streptomyces sp. NPDC001279]|uniref:TetR/AcrR family transcriptional regulator n=1 Tax=Streptomyces sp. NPDC001279 TaxID=3364556 RepID=UPI0036A03668